jgi:hypothetical protein
MQSNDLKLLFKREDEMQYMNAFKSFPSRLEIRSSRRWEVNHQRRLYRGMDPQWSCETCVPKFCFRTRRPAHRKCDLEVLGV